MFKKKEKSLKLGQNMFYDINNREFMDFVNKKFFQDGRRRISLAERDGGVSAKRGGGYWEEYFCIFVVVMMALEEMLPCPCSFAQTPKLLFL